jgi:hypothetical protein
MYFASSVEGLRSYYILESPEELVKIPKPKMHPLPIKPETFSFNELTFGLFCCFKLVTSALFFNISFLCFFPVYFALLFLVS